MARDGKTLQIGGGSRRPSQARAEDAARRSRKRADERRWRREHEGRGTAVIGLPPPASSVELALVPPILVLWTFSQDIEDMIERTECLFTSI